MYRYSSHQHSGSGSTEWFSGPKTNAKPVEEYPNVLATVRKDKVDLFKGLSESEQIKLLKQHHMFSQCFDFVSARNVMSGLDQMRSREQVEVLVVYLAVSELAFDKPFKEDPNGNWQRMIAFQQMFIDSPVIKPRQPRMRESARVDKGDMLSETLLYGNAGFVTTFWFNPDNTEGLMVSDLKAEIASLFDNWLKA